MREDFQPYARILAQSFAEVRKHVRREKGPEPLVASGGPGPQCDSAHRRIAEVNILRPFWAGQCSILRIVFHLLNTGHMYDTITSLRRRYRVFKLFMREAEVDMVVYDRERRECVMVEVKHSSGRHRSHSRSLRDPEVAKALESRFHRIAGRYVLYRGEDFDGGGTVRFLNVERYLLGLPRTAEELFR